MITQHDIYRAASGEYRCRNCDTSTYSLFVDRGRSCPGAQQVARPATPEPPLWNRVHDGMVAAKRIMDAMNSRDLTYRGHLPDEAKIAATAQRVTPKLATAEPPEWKERKLPCIHCHKLGLEGEWCDCEQAQADMRECDAHWANLRAKQKATDVKFIQDRALEDFTVRRKAKRVDAAIRKWADGLFKGMSWVVVTDDATTPSDPLARAMSTPLPHDPDIRTRVMPWRGKP